MTRPKLTSAENGRHSNGPKTEEGRKRSHSAALKHGLCAQSIFVLPGESQEAFLEDCKDYAATFKPEDDVQVGLVMKLAGEDWLQCRARLMETAMFESARALATTRDPIGGLLGVFNDPKFALLQLYQGRLERSYTRHLNNLITIRREFGPAQDTSLTTASVPAPAVEAQQPADPPEPAEPAEAPPAKPTQPIAAKMDNPPVEPACPAQNQPQTEVPPEGWPKAA